MKRLYRQGLPRILTLVVLTIMLMWPASLLFDAATLRELLRGIALTVGAAVIFVYARGVFHELLSPYEANRFPGHLLSVGILLVWLSTLLRYSESWLQRGFWLADGATDWMLVVAVWMLIVAGVISIAALEAIDDYLPRTSWMMLGGIFLLGSLFGVVMTNVLSPLDGTVP